MRANISSFASRQNTRLFFSMINTIAIFNHENGLFSLLALKHNMLVLKFLG